MNYQKFKKLITEFKKVEQDADKLNKAFRLFDSEFNYISFSKYSSLILDCLREYANDEYKYIDYWIYDLEYGKKAKKGTVTDKDGKDIPIKTIKDLYNIIKNKDL